MASFQPLVSDYVDLYTTASLTTPDGVTGFYLDVDPAESSFLMKTNDTSALYIDKYQNVGINTFGPSAQLDINSASSNHIRLTYNNSVVYKSDIGVSSDGKLQLSSGGSEVIVDNLSNLNIIGHNGSTLGLMLGNSLVLSTAVNLNYNVVTAGTASNSKTMVLSSSGSISGIGSLSANELSGTLETSYQPNLTSVDTFDITGHNGVAGLSLGGVLVSAIGSKLNNLNTTVGVGSASKYLVLDENRDIMNLNSLTASTLSGVLQTASQSNITSLGSLSGLTLSSILTGLSELSIGTTAIGRSLVLNDTNGDTLRLLYDAATSTDKYVDLLVNPSGGLMVTPSSGNVDIVGHNGSTKGLRLGGTLVTAISDQLNYMQGTAGVVVSGKSIILDSSRNVSNISSLSAVNLSGTLQTVSQPNLTSLTTLNVTGHNGTIGLKLGGVLLTVTATQLNSIFGAGGAGTFSNLVVNNTVTIANANGSTKGLKLGTVIVTSSADELNYSKTELGVVVTSKSVVVDANKDISSFGSLSATNLTGTLQTGSQSNITSVGTLTSLNTSGSLTVGSTVIDASEISVIDGLTAGVASNSKMLVVDINNEIVGVDNLGSKGISLVDPAPIPGVFSPIPNFGTSYLISYSKRSNINQFAYAPALGLGIFTNGLNTIYKLNSSTGWDPTVYTINGITFSSSVILHSIWANSSYFYMIVRYTYPSPDTLYSYFIVYMSTNGVDWSQIAQANYGSLNPYAIEHKALDMVIVYCTAKLTSSTYSSVTSGWLFKSNGTVSTCGFQNFYTSSELSLSIPVGNSLNASTSVYIWNGTTWVKSVTPATFTLSPYYAYHKGEDRIYSFFTTGNCKVVNNVMSKTYAQIMSSTVALSETFSTFNSSHFPIAYYVETVGVIFMHTFNTYSTRVFIYKNNTATIIEIPGTTLNRRNIISFEQYPFISTESNLVIPYHIAQSTSYPSTIYFQPDASGSVASIEFSNSTITHSTISTLDNVSVGTVSASKLLTVDANKDISSLRILSATNLTGTIQTASQPNITSVGTLSGISTSGTLTLGSTTISESEIIALDSVTEGVVAPSKAAILDANKDLSGLNVLSLNSIVSTNLTLGSTPIENIQYVDTVSGTVSASKVVAVDSNKDISSFSNLTADNLTGQLQTVSQPLITSVGTLDSLESSGGITLGSTIISETEISKIDGITNGVSSAGKALVLDSNKDIVGINSFGSAVISVGETTESDLPIEVGFVNYEYNGDFAYMSNSNAHGLITSNVEAMNYSARFDGRVLCQGEIQITSDRRLKKNITELESAFANKFMVTTNPVKFNWKTEDEIVDYGYIAQDISKAGFDDMISVVPHIGMEGSIDEDGFVNPKDAKIVFSPGKIIPLVALDQRSSFESLEKKNCRIEALLEKVSYLEQYSK